MCNCLPGKDTIGTSAAGLQAPFISWALCFAARSPASKILKYRVRKGGYESMVCLAVKV